LVLTRFNGRTWTGREPSISRKALDEIEVLGDRIDYEVTLEPTLQQWVFALDMPIEWSLQKTFMGPYQELARSIPIDQRVAYNATSYTSFRVGEELSDLYRRWYSALPENTNPRTAEFARQMRGKAPSDRSFVESVLTMLHEQDFYYTLQPPPLGSDPVDRFLFETRRGFCEHYASAFAVLMRSVGIPTRIVLGYQGGEMNPIGGHLIVRQSDAHAWTEVWLEGEGWVRVDPTAAVAPERVEIGTSDAAFDGIGETWGFAAPPRWVHQATMAWDALNARWNEWILGYGPETQETFMRWLGMLEPTWRKMMLTLIALVVGVTIVISAVLMIRYRPPAKDEAARLYARFVAKTGVEPLMGETPRLFARRVRDRGAMQASVIEAITEAYLDARYGGIDQAHDRLRKAVAAIS
jgi:transglutaminase-like putative cysteine protease